MPAPMLTCQGCGAALRTNDPSPAGKLIRCPVCRIVFKAPVTQSSTKSSTREVEVNCADCGATLQADQALRPGQLVQCPKCTTIFRVPGSSIRSPSASERGHRNLSAYFE